MLNAIYSSFDHTKSPNDQDTKVPFKNSLHINRAERLLAKEIRDQSLNAVLQDAWKCACMLPTTNFENKDLQIIDHLQKRNCQKCGAFVIGIGNEDEDSPLMITISNKNGNSATKVISCVENSKPKRSSHKDERNNENSAQKHKFISNQKVKALKQQEDHFFADMSPSEIYSYLRLEESSQRFKQAQGRFITLTPQTLKIRKQLVDWIFEIGEKLKQRILTTHLAVVYLDILIQDEKIFDKIQQEVLPCVCMLLASKFDELDDNIPLIRELQKVFANHKVIAYDDIIKAEQTVLFKLNWDLFKLASMHFLQNLLGQGIVFSNDKVQTSKLNQTLTDIDEKTLKSVKKHSEFFADLAIQEYDISRMYKPSVIAISCIVLARKMSRIIPEWNSVGLEELTDYTYDGEVKKCSDKLYRIYQKQFGIVANNKTPNCRITLQQSTGKSEGKQNKHNKENQEKLRSVSTSNRENNFKSTIQNNQTTQNSVVTRIQFIQKFQIIQEENEPTQISHNTTRSNESSDIVKGNPQFSLNDYLDPYQLFDHSLEKHAENIKLRNKPESKQQPKKQTNESKLTLTNSYSSDPQSPSIMIQENQHTAESSNITSQNKINQLQRQPSQRQNNKSQVRKQDTSQNPPLNRKSTNPSVQNTQSRSQNMNKNAATQRNLSKTRSQPGLIGLKNNQKQELNQQMQQQYIINPSSFSSAVKICPPPQSTKNMNNENITQCQTLNINKRATTASSNLQSCRNQSNNLSQANNASRNGNSALQVNGLDNNCQTYEQSSSQKVADIFQSQKSQVSRKCQNQLTQSNTLYSNRATEQQQDNADLENIEILSSQNTHRHQLSMVPSSSNIATMSRPTKRSMDLTSKHKKVDQKPQTTKNSNLTRKPISSIKLNQNIAQNIIGSQEGSLTRICVFDTQLAQQQVNNNNKLNSFKPLQSNYEKYLSQDNQQNSQSKQDFKVTSTQKKIFDRKKSSALKNTTLEEIYENKQENFMLSPSLQYSVQTTKNVNTVGGVQSFSLTGQNNQNKDHIQRNKAYVNQLNQRVKDKKSNEQGVSSLMTSHINSKSTTNILTGTQFQRQQEKQKSNTKLNHITQNFYNSNTADLSSNIKNEISQEIQNTNIKNQSSQASQNISAIMGFNSRRASDFNQCDYLKPTLSSMCRAKSVVPGMKKAVVSHLKSNLAQNVTNTLTEQPSFDLTTKNKVSPNRVGPIQVYDRNNKSIQKRQGSGIRKPQYRDDHSNERLRMGLQFTNNFTQDQSNCSSNTNSRLSLGNRHKVQPQLRPQASQQTRIINKSQRNSVSMSFNQITTVSTCPDDSVKSNINNKPTVLQQAKSNFAQHHKHNQVIINNSQQVQQQKKQGSSNNLNFSTQYQDTQVSSAANLLSSRTIGGAAIIEEDEQDEIMQSLPSLSQFEHDQQSSNDNQNNITHEYNFEDEGSIDDTLVDNAVFQGDQNFGNKSITHVISRLPDESSQQYEEEDSMQREDEHQIVNSSTTHNTFQRLASISSSFDSNNKEKM